MKKEKTFLNNIKEEELLIRGWYPKTVGFVDKNIHPSTMIPDSYRENTEEFIELLKQVYRKPFN
jgi:hypothetical protein